MTRRVSITPVRKEQRLRSRTPESRAFAERVQLVMNLTARLNMLPFDDLNARRTLLVPPLSVVTGTSVVERRRLTPAAGATSDYSGSTPRTPDR